MATAMSLAEHADSPFDLAAALNDQVANWNYSFGAVAPETLASAYALALAADGDPMTAIPAAATIAKQADSVPAMVGAVTGALAGVDRLPGDVACPGFHAARCLRSRAEGRRAR
jgi:ADP-ribosylglycohydrolase